MIKTYKVFDDNDSLTAQFYKNGKTIFGIREIGHGISYILKKSDGADRGYFLHKDIDTQMPFNSLFVPKDSLILCANKDSYVFRTLGRDINFALVYNQWQQFLNDGTLEKVKIII